ncbi:MAG: tyrosine--tRNA ligase [Candidatus Dojkabacteria bacterium]|nr:MAG: tyrosine--tRNA ligase [Candidatus Dojkabacteria bacterium]
MTEQSKLDQVLSHPLIAEILNPEELTYLVESGTKLRHYIGFEISGNPHIGSGIITMSVVKALQALDSDITIFLADWHSWINHKLGGDRDLIKRVALHSFKHMMNAAAIAVGADHTKINYVLGSDLYEQNPQHWASLVEVSQHTTLARVKRSIDIMGRKNADIISFSSLIYPPLQVADIFTLQVNIAHAGTDQRKAHVIARKVGMQMTVQPLKDVKGGQINPIAIHHQLLPGLMAPPEWPITPERVKELIGEMKMSKSKPDSAIFMNDTPDDIRRKVSKAFCPEGDITYNPVMIWAQMIVFGLGYTLDISRPEKWGGNLHFDTYEELEKTFVAKELHPQDLKSAIAEHIVKLLEPAHKYLSEQTDLAEIQKELQGKITR